MRFKSMEQEAVGGRKILQSSKCCTAEKTPSHSHFASGLGGLPSTFNATYETCIPLQRPSIHISWSLDFLAFMLRSPILKFIEVGNWGWSSSPLSCGVVSAATFKASIYSARSNDNPLKSNGLKYWLSELKGGKFRCGYHRVQRLLGQGSGRGDAGKDKGLWEHLRQYGKEGTSDIWVSLKPPSPS